MLFCHLSWLLNTFNVHLFDILFLYHSTLILNCILANNYSLISQKPDFFRILFGTLALVH